MHKAGQFSLHDRHRDRMFLIFPIFLCLNLSDQQLTVRGHGGSDVTEFTPVSYRSFFFFSWETYYLNYNHILLCNPCMIGIIILVVFVGCGY